MDSFTAGLQGDEISGLVARGDCFDLFKRIDSGTVAAVITDPPYFLDGMGDTWDEAMTGRKTTAKQTISSLRAGMKFDKQQGKDFQEFMEKVAVEAERVLKPGGWFISFSAPRLYHRLAVGVEDAGFEVRDMWEWLYLQNQAKAMSVARSLAKDEALTEEQRGLLAQELAVWKTPQVKSCFEPILMAQKPREGTFYENWKKHHVGLVNVETHVEGEKEPKFTANVKTTEEMVEQLNKAFLVGKPTKAEKGKTKHLSVKPLALMQHLAEVLVPAGELILDPFNGSGSTGLGALASGRRYLGFEKDEQYFEESRERFEGAYSVEAPEEGVFTVSQARTKDLFAL